MPKNRSTYQRFSQRGGQGVINTVVPTTPQITPKSLSFTDRAKNFAKEAALVAAQEAQRIALATAMAATEEAGRVATESLQSAAQGKPQPRLEDILYSGAKRIATKASDTATLQAQTAAAQRIGLVPAPTTQIMPIPNQHVPTAPLSPQQLLALQTQAMQSLQQEQIRQPVKPTSQLSPQEKKSEILSHLSTCLPQIQSMDEFSELLVQCLSQAAGELYVPSRTHIGELSAGLKTMRDHGADFADPETVKTLLYGSRSAKKLLDLIPGYDQVITALDKIVAGEKIPAAELEALELATAFEMPEAIAQIGGFYEEGNTKPSKSSMDWMGKAITMANELGLMGELQNLQAVLADGKITEDEFKTTANRLMNVAQRYTQPKATEQLAPITSQTGAGRGRRRK